MAGNRNGTTFAKAVRAAMDKVSKLTIAHSVEYACWVYWTKEGFRFTEPKKGGYEKDGTPRSHPGTRPPNASAMVHSHPYPKFKGDGMPFAVGGDDADVALWQRVPVYMANPYGEYYGYDFKTDTYFRLFWDRGKSSFKGVTQPHPIKDAGNYQKTIQYNKKYGSPSDYSVPGKAPAHSSSTGLGIPSPTIGSGFGLASIDVPRVVGGHGGFGGSTPADSSDGSGGIDNTGGGSSLGPTGPSAPEREDYGPGGGSTKGSTDGSSKGNGGGGNSAGSQTGNSSSSKGKLPSAFGPKKGGTDGDQDSGNGDGNSDIIDIEWDDAGDGVDFEGDGVNEPPHAEPAPPADDGNAPPAHDDDNNGDHDDGGDNGDHDDDDDDDNGDHDDDEDIGDHDSGYSPDESPFDLKTSALGLSKQFEQGQTWRELVFGPRPETKQEFDGWQQQHGDVVNVGRRSAGDDIDTPIIEHLVATYGDVAAATLAAREAARQALKFATGVFDPVEAQATSMLEVTGMVSKADGWGDGGADGS